MLNKQLLNPSSIVVIGGSNEVQKPGGKLLKILLESHYKGQIYVVNPKEDTVQGVKSYRGVADLPEVDLAILAIPAKLCVDAVSVLTAHKNTRAFVVISAGFSESGPEGTQIEDKLVEIISGVNGVLIGPNGIGVITPSYQAVFTEPIPAMDPLGIDFVSGSGATAVFIIDAGIRKGLKFSSVYSVGNSAQIGVEDILKHMDENFDPVKSPRIKLLYLENIANPKMLLKHAASLVQKGCKIAAIKSGASEAGSRAASSHTGALASSDVAVDALFKKAGIIRCFGRDELLTVACAFIQPKAKGHNFAIITHAGGPAVMLTDGLSKYGLNIPQIKNEYNQFLLDELFPGSSVSNPIDFLATGTADQLNTIIEFVNKKFDEIDAMVVIFGTPGLSKVFDAYDVIHRKMQNSIKPIYPVLPSEITASDEIREFVSKGNVYFNDEVLLANALGKIYSMPDFEMPKAVSLSENDLRIRNILDEPINGYLHPDKIQELLDAMEIPRVFEAVAENKKQLLEIVGKIDYPLVMKVVGPVHKSDVGGVSLNIKTEDKLVGEFERMMKIPEAVGVLVQPMIKGIELYMGAKYEDRFGHLVLCGLGGIYIELIKDVATGLCPLTQKEAYSMVQSLKSYKIFKGARGQKPVNEDKFVDILLKLSKLVQILPEIEELDFNPLLADGDTIIVVDARIKINKTIAKA
jgi:acetate---CoA ligase (ADP-forming)